MPPCSRTRRSHATALLLLLLLPACVTDRPQRDEAADRQQVEAAARRIWDALNRNDGAAVLAEYAEDAIIFPDGAPMVRGKDAVSKYLTGVFTAVAFKDVTGTLVDVTVSGDLAVETGTFRWTVTPAGGAPTQDRLKYVHVWERTGDGSWKVIRYFANSDVAPPAP